MIVRSKKDSSAKSVSAIDVTLTTPGLRRLSRPHAACRMLGSFIYLQQV